jgi:GNAT superfamily N-acetyltransferase
VPVADLDPALGALFGRVWPALPEVIARAAALGFPWTAVSTPLVRRAGGRVVGHVGVIELPLVMAGQRRPVAAIHAVCTDPESRRRGIATALMEEALAACARRHDTVVLTTLSAPFYARLGFRPVREHAFARALAAGPRAARGRPLTGSAEDVRLLRRLLAGRAPVSGRLASLEDGTVLVVALLLTWGDFSRVHYHAGLDVVTVHEVRDRTLVLYDVVGATIPALDALVTAIGPDADRVVTFFVPDRLGEGFMPIPWDTARAAAAGDSWFAPLMARGPLEIEAEPFMLQPLSRT